jgi:hypothetical protein
MVRVMIWSNGGFFGDYDDYEHLDSAPAGRFSTVN